VVGDGHAVDVTPSVAAVHGLVVDAPVKAKQGDLTIVPFDGIYTRMSLKQKVMERGMKLISDPRVMKLMSNPRVMNVVMKGFQLRGKAQASIDARVKKLANTLKLATREEVSELKQTIRALEQSLRQVQADLAKPESPTGKKAKSA
jgi:hypothetical protein